MYNYFYSQLDTSTGKWVEGTTQSALDTSSYVHYWDNLIWAESQESAAHARELVRGELERLRNRFIVLCNENL